MIGWVDATAGAAGDMLLGALVGAGVPLDVLRDAVGAVTPEPVTLEVEEVRRGGLVATRVHVRVADSATHRTWTDVRRLLDDAPLAAPVRARAQRVFERLATAEGAVHGIEPAQVHFHEVGALDAIADVVGVCAGVEHLAGLGLERLVVSPVAVGSGRVEAAHGSMPVPVPAVAELLRGVPSLAGPAATEACTPTGAALLAALADSWGPQPAMTVSALGAGAGGRDPETHANVVRLLVGDSTESPGAPEGLWLLETNLDDLDPRLLPLVLDRLLELGANDAWLTPIVMKKGRPAHVLAALLPHRLLEAVQQLVFEHTSSIGVRFRPVDRAVCDRRIELVDVDGRAVEVKVASWRGRVVNAQPELESVRLAADALGRSDLDVLGAASAAARALLSEEEAR